MALDQPNEMSDSTRHRDEPVSRTKDGGVWTKVLVFAVVLLAVVIGYTVFGDALRLSSLAEQESRLRALQTERPLLVYGAALAIYVVVTGLSLPGATALTLVYGWYFGLWRGTLIVSFASTAGATLAFLLSRFLFRDAIRRRFHARLQEFDESFAREGPFFLFALRLIPAVPFFVINVVMGLTPIRTWTYWWVSQLGMLPGTIVYVYAGSSVPSLRTLADQGISAVFTPAQLTRILIAFAALAVFPLAVRYAMRWWGRRRTNSTSDGGSLSRTPPPYSRKPDA